MIWLAKLAFRRNTDAKQTHSGVWQESCTWESPRFSNCYICCSADVDCSRRFRSTISRSSRRSVVIRSFSRGLALNSTIILLLLVEIRPWPLSKWVISIVSASDRCRASCTRWASSSSRFRMILVLELLMMPLPNLPPSRSKKSARSWLAKIEAPP